MKLNYVFIYLLLVIFVSGCSKKDWYRVYDQCQPVNISYCDSGSFKVYLGRTMSFRMIGPPYLPIIPIPIGDSKHIYVFIEPKYDSLFHPSDSPELGLRSKDNDILVKPIWTDSIGQVRYNTFEYRYYFDIGANSPDTLEVVFLKKFLGCNQPSITFIATKVTVYKPFEFPAN